MILYNWDINETQTTTQEMEVSIPAEAALEKQNLMFCLNESWQTQYLFRHLHNYVGFTQSLIICLLLQLFYF